MFVSKKGCHVHGHHDSNGISSQCRVLGFSKITDKNCFHMSYKYLTLKFENSLKAIKKAFPIASVEIMQDCIFEQHLKDKKSPIYKYFQEHPWKPIKDFSLRSALRGGRCSVFGITVDLPAESKYEIQSWDVNFILGFGR